MLLLASVKAQEYRFPRRDSLLTGRVAVEGEQVGGAAGDARDGVGGRELADAVAQGDGAGVALEGSEVGSEAGNVRRGH